jgi:gas vesicle protein
MKRSKVLSLISGSLTALAVTTVAQTNPPPPAPPAISDRPVVLPPIPAPDRLSLPTRPERPAVPGKPTPSKDMRDLVRDFQTARESFRKQQLELNRQLKTANDQERALIREQIRENLKQWLEEQKARVQDLREQATDMAEQVKGLGEVIKSGAEPKDRGPRGRP